MIRGGISCGLPCYSVQATRCLVVPEAECQEGTGDRLAAKAAGIVSANDLAMTALMILDERAYKIPAERKRK